jgi:hypothetical protein
VDYVMFVQEREGVEQLFHDRKHDVLGHMAIEVVLPDVVQVSAAILEY